jgi:tRNA (guanosine-2'-O-)-methyltransferase
LKIEAPEHVTLQAACTPTGPELCFNAIDDNCNGVIDEGCGVGTGVLQFTIAWNEETADVDLSVVDPSGSPVNAQRRSAPSGLKLDRDCPGSASAPSTGESCNGQNTENVFFEGLEPPRGRYLVEVRLIDPHGASTPVQVHFGARVGSRTYGADVALSPGDNLDRKAFKFEL